MVEPSSAQPNTSRCPAPALAVWLMPLAGVLLALAFPNEIVPGHYGERPPALLGWLALLPLCWAVLRLDDRAARRAAWLFGLGFLLISLSWMRLFGLLPWALLAAYLALTPWLALHLAQRMPGRAWWLPVNFALAWAGLEWLRAQGTFGLAWSEVGASQVDGHFAHLAAVGGVPLITGVMLALGGALVQRVAVPRTPRWLLPAVTGAVILLLLAAEWQTSLAAFRWRAESSGRMLAVVQPNTLRGLVPRDLVRDHTPEEERARLTALLRLSEQATAAATSAQPPLVIWPESAIPDPPYAPGIYAFARQADSMLLIGAPAAHYDPARRHFRPRNAAYLLAPDGRVLARYDKMHLVPFGEFVPLRPLVERFYTVRGSDIEPGETRELLRVDGMPAGCGICFESADERIARAYAGLGARLLIYITNDAWFHRTSAVRQHWNHARFRAIETGLPVARAASTGISGFIAPDGRPLAEIPTYTAGFRTFFCPPGTPGTLHTRGGWLFGPAALGVSLLLALIGVLRQRAQCARD